MDRPTCATCAAFSPLDDEFGECRRHSPKRLDLHSTDGSDRDWPVILESDWCLEHVAKVDDNPFPQAPICAQCGVDRAEYVGRGRYGTKCQSCAEMALGAAERVEANEANLRKLIAEHLRQHSAQQATPAPMGNLATVFVEGGFEVTEDPMRAIVSAMPPTQGPKPETPAAPAPSPEPDPQGL